MKGKRDEAEHDRAKVELRTLKKARVAKSS
jgi:hypothetical protein